MTDKDLTFLRKKTRLTKKKFALLCEVERDLDLVIEQVALRCPNPRDFAGLSFRLYTKLIIFSETRNINFDIEEKAVVSNMIADIFPKLNNRTNFNPFIRRITAIPTLSGAKYYFLLDALFQDKVNIKDPVELRLKYIQEGLSVLGAISQHVGEWIKILKRLKNSGLFSVNIEEEQIPELLEPPRAMRPKNVGI